MHSYNNTEALGKIAVICSIPTIYIKSLQTVVYTIHGTFIIITIKPSVYDNVPKLTRPPIQFYDLLSKSGETGNGSRQIVLRTKPSFSGNDPVGAFSLVKHLLRATGCEHFRKRHSAKDAHIREDIIFFKRWSQPRGFISFDPYIHISSGCRSQVGR